MEVLLHQHTSEVDEESRYIINTLEMKVSENTALASVISHWLSRTFNYRSVSFCLCQFFAEAQPSQAKTKSSMAPEWCACRS